MGKSLKIGHLKNCRPKRARPLVKDLEVETRVLPEDHQSLTLGLQGQAVRDTVYLLQM